jgi:hypothetical protein
VTVAVVPGAVVLLRGEALQGGREVRPETRLELDRGDAGRGAGHEHGHGALGDAGLPDGLGHAVGDVVHLAVAAGGEAEFQVSDRHHALLPGRAHDKE